MQVEREATLFKRSRSTDNDNVDDGDDDDDDDDNVSLVSRTPSPDPLPPELITVETKIKSTNRGFAMLAKLGWSEGQPLGLSADGRVDPIPFQIKNDLTGLGKINQDVRMIETTVSQRRELDSERQRKETQDQRKAREDVVAKRAAVRSEITDTLRPFYCTLCEKQFQNVAQYDEHTNSYAHHHKARLKDMQANARLVSQGDLDKRKEKERKREEKELRKLARAQGIKIAKPANTLVLVPECDTPATNETKPGSFKRAGWAAVTAASNPTDPMSSASATANPVPPSADSPTLPPPPALRPSDAPVFLPGGWTSLDSSSSQFATPPTPSVSLPPPPPPPPPPADTPPPPLPPVRQSYPPSEPLVPPPPPAASGWQQWKQGGNSKRR